MAWVILLAAYLSGSTVSVFIVKVMASYYGWNRSDRDAATIMATIAWPIWIPTVVVANVSMSLLDGMDAKAEALANWIKRK